MQDGVYLGLPFADYIAAPGRRGSTDFVRLFARGPGWWWTSPHNPHYVNKATDAQNFGTALHTLLLEGREAYSSQFATMPNPRDYPNLLVTADDLRSALDGTEAPLKGKNSKADLVEMAKAFLKDRPVWDTILEKWNRTARDKAHLTSGEAYAIEAMYEAAMADPSMRDVCTGGGMPRLTEVSVFYTCARGLSKRFRFDSLLPQFNVDLKSIADWKARPFEQSCAARIREDHLNIQLAMSHEARLAAYALINAGRVFGSFDPAILTSEAAIQVTAEDIQPRADWLRRFPIERPLRLVQDGAGRPGWHWLWLFYQKPEAGAAPSLLPLIVPWGDDLHRNGWRKLRIAEGVYMENVARFGLDKPWTQVRQAHSTQHGAARRVEVVEWDAPMQQDGEGEAMEWRT